MDQCTQKWIDIAVRDHLNSEFSFNLCGICNDKATGRHYGAISCDGCKGFFRRSVRNNNVYSCRFERRCPVEKDKRNQCRYCRLRKCFVVGMKMEAVQNERDRIKPQPRVQDEQAQIPGLSVMALRQAEVMCRGLTGLSENCSDDAKRRMTLKEMRAQMKNQMSPLVAWAKSIPMFAALTPIDQISLVRSFALSNLILTAVRLSLKSNNVLVFGGGWYLPGSGANGHKRKKTDDSLSQIGVLIFEELVRPLFDAQADVGDLACLKAISFFNPYAEHLVDREQVKKARSQIQVNLQDRLQDNQYDFRGRFGDLLLTLASLQGVTIRLFDLMCKAGLYDVVDIESHARSLLRMPKLVLGPVNGKTSPDGKDDSSGTLSSPNTPPLFDVDVVEQITVKCEPEEFEDDDS